MKRLIAFTIFLIIAIVGYSQSGISTFKYETRFPSIRVGGATKVKLDSITQNVDTIKFYNGATELVTNGAGIWTGTGVRLDTTLAKITLGIDQVPNLSLAAMFNEPIFTSITRVTDGILPIVSGVSYLGSPTYQWGNIYLREGSTLNWNNADISLVGGSGELTLMSADFDLTAGNLFTTGNIGANGRNINYGYFDSLYVANPIIGNLYGISEQVRRFWPQAGSLTLNGADSITINTTGLTNVTLPTSGTLLTTAVLTGYAPLNGPNFTGDMTVEYIRPSSPTGVVLGHPSYPWANLYMNSTAGVVWDATTDIILSPVGGELRLENSPLLIDNNDIGKSLQRVRKGWFTDLEITNLPTINGGAFKNAMSLTASDVGLGNVTNESKATMFTNPTFTGTTTLATPFTLGSTSVTATGSEINSLAGVTGSLAYSTENYGATGTGDIVLSIGSTLTTVTITDVITLTPMENPPSGATEGMIYADTDHHLYYFDGTSWKQLDN